jgi:hypothetical protein
MRKRLIAATPGTVRSRTDRWLDIDRSARVCLCLGRDCGLARRRSGPQTIRMIFDQPQRLKQVSLVFEGNRDGTDARVRLTLVLRWRESASGISRRAYKRHHARIDHRAECECPGLTQESARVLKVFPTQGEWHSFKKTARWRILASSCFNLILRTICPFCMCVIEHLFSPRLRRRFEQWL